VRTLLRDLGTVSGVQCACIVRKGEVLATTFPDNDKVAQAASLGFVRGISDGLELVDRGFEEMLIDFNGRSLMVTPVAKDFVLAMLAAPDANKQLLRVVMGSSARQLRRMHDIPEKAEAPQPKPAVAAQPSAQPAPGAAPRPGAPSAPPPPPRPQPAAPPPPPQAQAAAAKPAPTGRPQPPQPAGRPAPPPPPQAQVKAAPPQPPKPGQAPPAQPAASAAKPGTPPPSAAKPEPAPAAAAKGADKDAEPVLPQVLALLTEYIGPVARVSFKRGVTRWRETSTPTVGTLGELAKILAADLSSDSEKKAFLDAVERLRGG
jgi:predicted regulator of Ras-like GTPase activity (Roadblock/LC7/MglB family)